MPLFDEEFALNQFSGNRDLLIKMLDKFTAQYENLPTTLNELVSNTDNKGLKLLVHTVKGVSGNLGLKDLHIASKDFEASIENGISSENLDAFNLVVANSLNSLNQFSHSNHVPEPKPATNQATSPEQTEAKQNLIDALNRNEFITKSKLSVYLADMSLPAGQTEAIKNAINELDYLSAKKLLGERQ